MHPTNKLIIDRFIEIITEAGYDYRIVRANALEYGVPQKRKRLFIIGTKGTFKREEPVKTHCAPDKCEETGLKPYETAGKAIAGFEGDEYFEEYEVTKGGTYYDDLSDCSARRKVLAGSKGVEGSQHPNLSLIHI